jgi:glycosyltransferase involved in cell wall biosynthesis
MLDRESGLLVDISKGESWADSIIWALDNINQMQRWAENGRDFVLEKFSIDKNIEELIKLIDV